jgi:hypothetical protein
VAEEGDGWRLPIPSWEELADVNGASLEGLDGDRLRLVRSRAVDQPFGTYTRPLRLTKPAREALPKLLIACSYPLGQVREMIAGAPVVSKTRRSRVEPCGTTTGHWPTFSRP